MNSKPWLQHYDKGVPASLAPYPNKPLFAFLEESAAKYPDRPCTIFKGRVLTYKEVNELSDRMAAGLAAMGVKPGDRVIAEQIVPCARCRYCRSGKYWMCEVHDIFGFQREVADGGMAEYMRIPSTAIVHRIPERPGKESDVPRERPRVVHLLDREYSLDFLQRGSRNGTGPRASS